MYWLKQPIPANRIPVKPPLQMPIARGQWLVRGIELLCRLSHTTVAVWAPQAVLRRVMDLCDGTRSWPNVQATLGKQCMMSDSVGARTEPAIRFTVANVVA